MYVQEKIHSGGSRLNRSCRHWKMNVAKLIERSHTLDRRKTKRRVSFLLFLSPFPHYVCPLKKTDPRHDILDLFPLVFVKFHSAIRIRVKTISFWIIVCSEIFALILACIPVWLTTREKTVTRMLHLIEFFQDVTIISKLLNDAY